MTQAAEVKPNGQEAATELALVRPILTSQQAIEEWNRYTQLCRDVLSEQDYIYCVCGKKNDGYDFKPMGFATRAAAEAKIEVLADMNYTELCIKERKKRSAWDKLAKFYNLSLPRQGGPLTQTEIFLVGEFIIEKRSGDSFTLVIYQNAKTLGIVKASVVLSVEAPNGRVAIGEAACSTAERKFAQADHDIPSTAFTRALNRAVSRCIGTGEVSAEEFEAEADPAPQNGAPPPEAPVAPSASAGPAQTLSEKSVTDTPTPANTSPAPGETPANREPVPPAVPAPAPPSATPKGVTPERVAERFGGAVKPASETEKTQAGPKVDRPAGRDGAKWYLREVLDKAGVKEGGELIKRYVLKAAGVNDPKKIKPAQWDAALSVLDAKLNQGGKDAVVQFLKESATG